MKKNIIKIETLIRDWRLNQAALAERMDMPVSTMKNKLRGTETRYSFSEEEIETLLGVLDDLQAEINEVLDDL